MPPKGLQSYIDSKSGPHSGDAEAGKTSKQTLTRERARDLGFYIDTKQFDNATARPSSTPAAVEPQYCPRTSLPAARPGTVQLSSSEVDHNVFDTDASLHDDLSSLNDMDDAGSLPRSGRSTPLNHGHNDDMQTLFYSRLPHHQSGHHQRVLSAADLNELAHGRVPTPVSYPATSVDGTPGNDDRSPPAQDRLNDNRESKLANTEQSATAQPRAWLSTQPISGLPTISGGINLPQLRSLHGQRLTIVREPTVFQPTPVGRIVQADTLARPSTSKGLNAPPVPMTAHPVAAPRPTIPLLQISKSSTLGEVSDSESSPPPVDTDDLDYTPEQLRAMQFRDLREEPVDIPPAVPPDPSVAMETHLASALHSADADRQRSLLESLTVDRWEEAGDWFVARFADILKRSVAIRKEKRRLAFELEAEIEARHHLIEEKRQLLEENLKGLREAGGRVLEVGTPKKKRARKET
ncbi:hypothetical protein ANO11243_029520 [Dothideomycetidae sp. 11243]|nr:hypothetical protein ANO11243_029520 [fungal sp. No.11243]